jgi:hypothetical protein
MLIRTTMTRIKRRRKSIMSLMTTKKKITNRLISPEKNLTQISQQKLGTQLRKSQRNLT